jgi:geranylgeranyl pyrophosphate synthase
MLLTGLAGLVLVFGIIFLFQRTTLASKESKIKEQAASILSLEKIQVDLQGQVADSKAQINRIKKSQKAQQVISNTTATLMAEVEKIKSKCVMEKNDEEILNSVVRYFNAFGMLFPVQEGNSGAKGTAKVLP